MQARPPARDRFDDEHLLWLKSLILLTFTAIALVAAWHYGLLQQVLFDDPSGLASAIALIFGIAVLQGAFAVWRLSKVSNTLRLIERRMTSEPDMTATLEDGPVRRYVEALARRRTPAAGEAPDMLLDAFSAEVTAGHGFGWFVSDVLLSLGLLGTVIGFIAMLAPIGQLESGDEAALKAALTAMSGGMAIALYTTLTGLIGAVWLKVQGFLLDSGADDIIRRMKWVTELHGRRDPARGSLFAHRSALSALVDDVDGAHGRESAHG
ncbi:MAG: MotA/TolQ/ExbB proton channel family protein [Geminicoccaceae bacterium]